MITDQEVEEIKGLLRQILIAVKTPSAPALHHESGYACKPSRESGGDPSNASVQVCNASLKSESKRLRDKAHQTAAYQTEYMQVGMNQLAQAYEDAAALLESRMFVRP